MNLPKKQMAQLVSFLAKKGITKYTITDNEDGQSQNIDTMINPYYETYEVFDVAQAWIRKKGLEEWTNCFSFEAWVFVESIFKKENITYTYFFNKYLNRIDVSIYAPLPESEKIWDKVESYKSPRL